MSSIARVVDFIKFKGINKSSFYTKTGLSNGYLDKVKEIGSDKIERILSAFPDLNIEWLISGKGSMFKGNVLNATPLITLEAAAGFGTSDFSISSNDIQQSYVVPDFNGIDFMIRVKGSSMYPKFSSGDIVACRILKEPTFIQWNKPYVIATREQGILCKRLMKSELKDHFKIVSDNKEYPEFDVPKSEITGVALIVGVIRLE